MQTEISLKEYIFLLEYQIFEKCHYDGNDLGYLSINPIFNLCHNHDITTFSSDGFRVGRLWQN